MTGEIHVTQKAALASDTTNIAVQNNYGIDAEKAAQLAINLFMENFPKLQEEARQIAKERAEELCGEVIKRLAESGKTDYSEFSDPDVQYIFYEAQKGYARFGESVLLQILSELVSGRIMVEKKGYVKRVYDKAVALALELSQSHIDYLTFVFLTKCVAFNAIKDIETLKRHCEYICERIVIEPNILNYVSYLNMLGCFEIDLGTASKAFSRQYNLAETDIKKILPEQYEYIPADYNLSPAAIVIAVLNAQKKTNFKLNLDIWIHE